MTIPIPPEQWRVVLANAGRHVITHPDDVASMLTDEHAAGTISIRRRSALPNEYGRLPFHWQDLDVFGEIDLDDVEVEHGEDVAADAGRCRGHEPGRPGSGRAGGRTAVTTDERITELIIQVTKEKLAALLGLIEAADTDYERRYGLVLDALALARRLGYPAGIGWDHASGPDFDGFRAVVYIQLPGEDQQISWHMPEWDRGFDGHTTGQKYERCHTYAEKVEAERMALLASREEASKP